MFNFFDIRGCHLAHMYNYCSQRSHCPDVAVGGRFKAHVCEIITYQSIIFNEIRQRFYEFPGEKEWCVKLVDTEYRSLLNQRSIMVKLVHRTVALILLLTFYLLSRFNKFVATLTAWNTHCALDVDRIHNVLDRIKPRIYDKFEYIKISSENPLNSGVFAVRLGENFSWRCKWDGGDFIENLPIVCEIIKAEIIPDAKALCTQYSYDTFIYHMFLIWNWCTHYIACTKIRSWPFICFRILDILVISHFFPNNW